MGNNINDNELNKLKNLEDGEAEKMGRKFLKIMKVEWTWINPFSERYIVRDSFQVLAAKEIIEKLFKQTDLEQLANLMTELGEKNPSLIRSASAEIDQIINEHIGTYTAKIFRKIKENFPNTLNLLGLVKIKKENFPASYNFFGKLLIDLNTPGNHHEITTVKNYFSTAVEELEEFVRSEQKENTSETESTEQGQTEEKKDPNKKPETNSSEQDGTSPPKKSPPNQGNNNQNQGLEKIRTRATTKISQAMQEAKLTDQDLPETDRQWKNLINNSSDLDYITSLKENLLVVIQQKKKEKADNEKLSEFIQKGEGTDNLEELKRIIEQIEGFRGEKVYDSQKEKISMLRKKLAEQDIEGYCRANNEMIEQELKDEMIEESELNAEVQKKLKKLREGGIQQAEIDTTKDEVSNNIKLKSAEKKLEKLLDDYQNNPSDEKKKEIVAFTKSSNSFYQKVYETNKDKVDSLLESSGSPSKKDTSESNFPVSAKYAVAIISIATVIFVLVEITKKKKSRFRRAW